MASWQSQKRTAQTSACRPHPLAVVYLYPLPHLHRALASPGMFPSSDHTGSFLWVMRLLQQRTLRRSALNFLGTVLQSETFPTQSAFLPHLLTQMSDLHYCLEAFPATPVSSPSSFSDVSPRQICMFNPISASASQRIWANMGLFCLRQEQAFSESLPCARQCAKCFISGFNNLKPFHFQKQFY